MITSEKSRGKLELCVARDRGPFDARWSARLETPSVTATHAFWSGGEASKLVDFFDDLASNWRGWDGRRAWTDGERNLSLAATHDQLGHVVLWVTLSMFVAPEAETWLVRAPLELEAGHLERVAVAARGLLVDD